MAVFQICQKSQLHRKVINNFMEPKGPMAHLCFIFSAGIIFCCFISI